MSGIFGWLTAGLFPAPITLREPSVSQWDVAPRHRSPASSRRGFGSVGPHLQAPRPRPRQLALQQHGDRDRGRASGRNATVRNHQASLNLQLHHLTVTIPKTRTRDSIDLELLTRALLRPQTCHFADQTSCTARRNNAPSRSQFARETRTKKKKKEKKRKEKKK
ncbi:hypothetical protein IWZ01DRAFT_365006 [Phyllosticta capitalensis]